MLAILVGSKYPHGVDVWITDTVRHETVLYHDSYPWHEASEYMWSDGNYGCDCNRGLFFERAATGIDEGPSALERPCGADRYKVRIIDPATKTVLYDEIEETLKP